MPGAFEDHRRITGYEVIAHKSGLGSLRIQFLPIDFDLTGLTEAEAAKSFESIRFVVTDRIASEVGAKLIELGSRLLVAKKNRS
jgi:hypothetical protein